MSTSKIIEELRGMLGDPVMSFKLASLAMKHKDDPLVAQYMLDHAGKDWELWAEIMSSTALQDTMEEIKVESRFPRHVRVKVLGSHLKGGPLPDPGVITDGYAKDEPDGDEMEMLVTRDGDDFTFTCDLAPEPVPFPDWPESIREMFERASEPRRDTTATRVELTTFEREALIRAINDYRRATSPADEEHEKESAVSMPGEVVDLLWDGVR